MIFLRMTYVWGCPSSCFCPAAAKSLQSCLTLCNPTDGSPPGSPIPGILQARTLECHFLLQCMKVKSESEVAQSYPTLSDPMDCCLPGSSLYGIFQARVLELPWPSPFFTLNLNQFKELMVVNCGTGKDSWESLEQQGYQTSQS